MTAASVKTCRPALFLRELNTISGLGGMLMEKENRAGSKQIGVRGCLYLGMEVEEAGHLPDEGGAPSW